MQSARLHSSKFADNAAGVERRRAITRGAGTTAPQARECSPCTEDIPCGIHAALHCYSVSPGLPDEVPGVSKRARGHHVLHEENRRQRQARTAHDHVSDAQKGVPTAHPASRRDDQRLLAAKSRNREAGVDGKGHILPLPQVRVEAAVQLPERGQPPRCASTP